MRALITGGAGFIGSHLARLCLAEGLDVRVLDNLRTGHRENLTGLDLDFREGTVIDPDVVRQAMAGVDYVFHLAALVSVPESMKAPREFLRTNVEGTLVVLAAAREAKVRKLCFSSSSAVYGDTPELPKREDQRPQPLSPYGIGKLDGELYCDVYRREGWLQTACLRYFNVFGPRQDPASPYAAVVPIFVDRALRHQDLPVYGDGGQTRDFVHALDVARANLHLARSTHTGVFNVAYGQAITIRELAAKIIAATASRSLVQPQPERPGDARYSQADTTRLRATGWRPATNLDDGLADTVDYFRARA